MHSQNHIKFINISLMPTFIDRKLRGYTVHQQYPTL